MGRAAVICPADPCPAACWAKTGSAKIASNCIYFALSATGIGALLASSYRFFLVAKWTGAAYLVYLGARAILGHHSVVPEAHVAIPIRGAWRLFADGLFLQLSNPKAIVFFSAILPQFIDPRHAILPQIVILGLTSTVCEFMVLCGYGIAASRASLLAANHGMQCWTNRLAGALLIGAGAGLALLRR